MGKKPQEQPVRLLDLIIQIEMAAFLIPEILTAPYDATKEDKLSSDLARVRREQDRAEKKLRAKLAKRVRSEPLQNLSAYLKRQGARVRASAGCRCSA